MASARRKRSAYGANMPCPAPAVHPAGCAKVQGTNFMLNRISSVLAGALLGLLLLAGCAATTSGTKVSVEVEVLNQLTRYEAVYLLQAGDVIEVFVYRHADLSRKSVVRPDGFISLPLLGEIPAAGKSPRELTEYLTERYAVRLKNPEVTVIVENPPEPVVFVLGEVGGPRALPLRQAKTVAQALAQAGNAIKTGDLFAVSIIRLNKEGYFEAHTVKAEGFSQPEAYMALQNMALAANDLVFVPESMRGQFNRAITDINSMLLPYYQYRVLRTITSP
jgi:polysaccharide export outer membrane protein